MWKILPRRILQSSQTYDQERKSNSKTLFKLWYWYKESDSTMPRLWTRNRKAKTKVLSLNILLRDQNPIEGLQ